MLLPMHKTMHFKRPIQVWALLCLLLLCLGCPRSPQLPTQPHIGGLLLYEYSGIRVMHQYSDRGYVHLRLHFGWQRPEENSYAAQNLAVEAAFQCGAGELGPAAFARKLESVGAALTFQPTVDGPVVMVDCLPDRLQAVWKLIDLCLTDPQFEKDSYARLRKGRVSAQKSAETDRGQQALEAARLAAWPESALSGLNNTAANLESVALVTAQTTFRDLMRQRCNLTLIVVGPIQAEKVSDLLLETVEGLPAGECADAQALPAPRTGQARLMQETRGGQALAGIFPGPSPASPVTVQMRLVMHMLERRLRDKLVVHDKLATRLDARYVTTSPGYNLIQISGGNAFQCAEFALSELRKMRTYGFLQREVDAAKAFLRSQIGLSYEAAPSLAAQLDADASAQIVNLAGNELPLLEACTPKSCSAMLNQYLSGISWGMVGDTVGVDRKSLNRL
jgi:predicted Zn-dependent peptidase